MHKYPSFAALCVCLFWPIYAALAALLAPQHRFTELTRDTKMLCEDLRKQPQHSLQNPNSPTFLLRLCGMIMETLVCASKRGRTRMMHKLTSSFGDSALSCAQHLRCLTPLWPSKELKIKRRNKSTVGGFEKRDVSQLKRDSSEHASNETPVPL